MCPHCRTAVIAARIEAVQLYELDGNVLNGVKYCCITCGAALSLNIDPIALKNDFVNGVLAGLGRL